MFAFGAYLLSAIVVDALFVIDLLKVGRDRKSLFGSNGSRAKLHSFSDVCAMKFYGTSTDNLLERMFFSVIKIPSKR